MIQSNLPFECKAIKYLNSSTVVVAGNSSHGHLEILRVDDNDMQESLGNFRNLSELEFPSSFLTDIEVCGVASQARTLVATANIDYKSKQGYICLIDARVSVDSCPLEVALTLGADDSISSFTSLSFHQHQTQLAAASDIGDVLVFDILSERQVIIRACGLYMGHSLCNLSPYLYVPTQISRFSADACGVSQVLYTRTGQLLTAGSSSASQLRLWDGRAGSSAVRAFSHPPQSSRPFVSYSSLALHPSLQIVYCGSCDGDVVEWDLRYETGKRDHGASLRTLSPHAGRVTSLAYHPSKDDALLSSSVDGTVKESLLPATATATAKSEKTWIEETYPSSIACTDVHIDYGTLVAASSTGSIWQIVL